MKNIILVISILHFCNSYAQTNSSFDPKSKTIVCYDENVLKNTDFSIFQDLRCLVIGGHALKTLPKGIENLTNLDTLRINSASRLDYQAAWKSICKLKCLRELTIQWVTNADGSGQIIHVPEEISALTELTSLSFMYTHIDSLPSTFGNLKKLEFLNLASTGISSLPKSFSALINLRTLYLEGAKEGIDNPFTEIPDYFSNFTKIENFSYQLITPTKITDMEQILSNFKKLKSCYIQGFTLEELDYLKQKFPKVEF